MRDILDVDPPTQRAVVQPGVINLDVTAAATPHGYYYAPDPSQPADLLDRRQRRGELRRRALPQVRLHHQPRALGARWSPPTATSPASAPPLPTRPATTCSAPCVGSEGTLGIVTEVTVRLTRSPEAVRTLLAAFRSTDDAGTATSAIIGAGVVPAAIEMMDALAIQAAEEAVSLRLPGGRRRGARDRARRAGRRGRRPARRGERALRVARARSRSGRPPTTRSGR